MALNSRLCSIYFQFIMKTQTTKELKLNQLKCLFDEIKSPYDQLELILKLIKYIRNKDSKLHIMDQYLNIFENNLDEIETILENEIIYFDPTPIN